VALTAAHPETCVAQGWIFCGVEAVWEKAGFMFLFLCYFMKNEVIAVVEA
jgi:hypothetical protein